MDGLLVIDKPAGPTSHDVVSRMRRVLKERGIGHTGTLDPMATGVLALVLGRATRLAKFMSAADKSYEAVVTLGVSTDTGDADGEPIGPRHHGPLPDRAAIDRALDAFRGSFLQQPPAFSAKKIGGQRSYELARAARMRAVPPLPAPPARPALPAPPTRPALPALPAPPAHPTPPALPAPITVRAHRIDVLSVEQEHVTLAVDCSAGFYVRSLAHDLGERLGTGAHLSALRRTRSGDFTLSTAMTLEAAEQDPDEAAAFVIPMEQLLPSFPAVVLTSDGVLKASHGRDLGRGDLEIGPGAGDHAFVRLIDREGGLVGIAEPAAPGLLHPCIVLL